MNIHFHSRKKIKPYKTNLYIKEICPWLQGGGGEKKGKFISTKRHIYMSFYQVKSIKNGCRCMNISNDEDK